VFLLRLIFANILGNLLILLRDLLRLPRRRPAWVRVELKEPLPARPPHRRFLRRRTPSLAGLARLLRDLAGDRRVEGVIVELHTLSGGWAQARSLRDLLARLRAAGKQVVVHLSTPSTRELYVACAATRIAVDESGPIGLIGLAAEALFFRRALEQAGALAETEYRGAYKSMGEVLVRDDMSPAQREATDAILDRVQAELASALAESRGVDEARATELLEGGPYTAAQALALGLVDEVAYADELLADRKPATPRAWRRARLLPLRWKPLFPRRKRVAVLPLHGAIVSGEGSGKRLGAEAAARALAALREDPRIAAAVLHIDSRGGSAPASDLIWHQVVRLAAKKPVVAYLHDIAASGGYYIACAATRIVAQPTTLTGSIGVVAGKVSLAGLFERAGVRSVVLARGPASTMLRVSHPYTDEERRRLAAEVDALYAQFVDKVAGGRRLDRDEAERHARGRVWTGLDAHERGLVDLLGDVEDAVRAAEELVGAPLTPVDAAVLPRHRTLLSRALAAEPALDELLELAALSGERALYYAPRLTVD
jgi:protease-4